MQREPNGLSTEKEAGAKQQLRLIRVIESTVSSALNDTIATLQLVMRAANLEPELFDDVYRAELGCRSTRAKISALVELYGGEDAASALRIASYDVVQFFTVVAEQMNKALGHKLKGDITFIPDYETEQTVSFDARRVCMILYHLVSNAIQHGVTENKNVEIRAVVRNRMLELSVHDHGGGIPKEKTENLFHGFMESISLQSLAAGPFPPIIHGIGLPLCQKLVQDMDGEIKFRNYRKGATFTVLLPQRDSHFRETSVYIPDDTLRKECMADLLAELGPNRGEK